MVELPKLPADSVHLTVTSPPYDGLRDYEGRKSFDPHTLAAELLRVTVDGGFAVVIIQDQTKDFAKSLTSFRLAVAFADAGWRLFETCIYQRQGRPGKWWSGRFRVDHEYIFIFLKGARPRCFDKTTLAIPTIHPGKRSQSPKVRTAYGWQKGKVDFIVGDTKCRGTVWQYGASCAEQNKKKLEHPATFPDKLARDLIACFSQPGDTVLDPFMGSGTVAVMAQAQGRSWIGIEIAQRYIDIAEARLEAELAEEPHAA